MLKVWIAGAGGQIGRALNDVMDPMQIENMNTDLDEMDIKETDQSSIQIGRCRRSTLCSSRWSP